MTKEPIVDLTHLVNDGRHFARRTPLGATEIVDSLTGKIIAIIRDPLTPPLLEKRILPNGEETWVDATLPDHVLHSTSHGIMAYHPWIVDLICEKIANGGTLTKICKEKGMPSYTLLSRWRRQHPEVQSLLDEARRDRAEFHRDRAMDVTEEVKYEEDVAAARLKHEAHKWAAGVDDGKFSPRSKVEATLTTPMQILVSTGIDRNPASLETRDVGENTDGKAQVRLDRTTAKLGDNGGDKSPIEQRDISASSKAADSGSEL